MDFNNCFSSNIKYLRNQHKMNQEELGKALGKDYSTIGKWELGQRSPNMQDTLDICKLFNIDLNTLLTRDMRFINEDMEQMLQDKIMDNVRLCTKEEQEQILQIIDVIRKSDK